MSESRRKKRNPDNSVMLDENGLPVYEETEVSVELEPELEPEAEPVKKEPKKITVFEKETEEAMTAEEFVESLSELKQKAKSAGLQPIRMMLTSYLNQGLSMVDGLLESLDGPKKKGK